MNVQDVISDKNFINLSPAEKRKVLQKIDSNFADLPNAEQMRVVNKLKGINNKPKDVPEWGKGNPNLYGVYGAAKGVGQTIRDTGGLAVEMVKNAPGDFVELLNETGQGIINTLNPNPQENTLNAIGSLALGGVQKIIPGEQSQEGFFDAAVGGISDAVGSKEKLNQYLAEHPMKAASFIPAAGLAVGGPLSVVGKASKVKKVADLGSDIINTSTKLDPINVAAKAATKLTKGFGNASAQGFGLIYGAGKEAVKEAFINRGTRFTKAMRGEIDFAETLGRAKEGLAQINIEKGRKIQSALGKIGQNRKINIDIRPIKSKLQDMMKKYNIKVVDGDLDFSRSGLSKSARADVSEIIQDVSSWGSQAGDTSPSGLHILKMRLDDFYSDSKGTKAIVSAMRKSVKNELVKHVPEYAKAMDDYAASTRVANEIEKALSLGDKAMMDTGIKKLLSTNRQNFEFRKSLLSQLEKETGLDLAGEIAGHAMSEWTPRGLMGVLQQMSVGAGAISGNLGYLAMLPLMSPRVAGEFLRFAGVPAKKAHALVSALKLQSSKVTNARNIGAATQRAKENYRGQNTVSPKGKNLQEQTGIE